MLALGIVLSLFFGMQKHIRSSRSPNLLDRRIAELAAKIGHTTPEPHRGGGGKPFLHAIGFTLGTAAIALLLILSEMS